MAVLTKAFQYDIAKHDRKMDKSSIRSTQRIKRDSNNDLLVDVRINYLMLQHYVLAARARINHCLLGSTNFFRNTYFSLSQL